MFLVHNLLLTQNCTNFLYHKNAIMFLVHNLLLTQNCTFIKTLIKINTINNTKVLKLNGTKCYCCLFSAIILLITQSNKSSDYDVLFSIFQFPVCGDLFWRAPLRLPREGRKLGCGIGTEAAPSRAAWG